MVQPKAMILRTKGMVNAVTGNLKSGPEGLVRLRDLYIQTYRELRWGISPCSLEAIHFMQDWQEDCHHDGNPLGMLVSSHRCCHGGASFEGFHKCVARPRDQNASDETHQEA